MKNYNETYKKRRKNWGKNPKKKKKMVEIKSLRHQINNVILEEIYWNLKRMQQKKFEFANKPGKYLVNSLKRKRTKRWITVIRREEKGGKETTDSREIK